MKNFTKNIENFTCANCGASVTGNGYTNHCHVCLWSRDVDNAPGDRASACGGMMRPVSVAKRGDKFIITHKCEKCGKTRNQTAAENDNMDAIIAVMRNDNFVFGKK
ncbi:MAG: RNHCP domain-containing protein [Rickettsiales bacterium]|jgi:ribosomal protein L37AE/L43A|nr:RNHCP domain-containing protein [Rickettsiales bacterium]